jgi:hypothetical protein
MPQQSVPAPQTPQAEIRLAHLLPQVATSPLTCYFPLFEPRNGLAMSKSPALPAPSLTLVCQAGASFGGTPRSGRAANRGFCPLACPDLVTAPWASHQGACAFWAAIRDTASNPTATGSILQTATGDPRMPEGRRMGGNPRMAQRRRSLSRDAEGQTIGSSLALLQPCAVIARAVMVPMESGCDPREVGGSPGWALVVYRPNSSSAP